MRNFIRSESRIDRIKELCSESPDFVPIILGSIISCHNNDNEMDIRENLTLINDFITIANETDLLNDHKKYLYDMQEILISDLDDIMIKNTKKGNDYNDI